MGLLLPVAAIVALWTWSTGRWRSFRWGDIAAIVAGLLAIRLTTHGELLPALIGYGWAGSWLWHRRRERRVDVGVSRLSSDEARSLLEVPPGADAATIRAAHRRLIVRVHPDAGGSAELARRVNGARDALLADLKRSRPRAS